MKIPVTLALLLLLPGCGVFFGECISSSFSGVVQDQDGDPIDGAEISECDWDDCSRLQVIGVSDADGRFEIEVTSRKETFGGCQDAWIRIAASGCSPQALQAEQFQAPIVLDCPGG